MAGWYALGVAFFAAIGTFLFVRTDSLILYGSLLTHGEMIQGFDTGIATTSTCA